MVCETTSVSGGRFALEAVSRRTRSFGCGAPGTIEKCVFVLQDATV